MCGVIAEGVVNVRKLKLEDVAKHAGVSPTTVSRVLNNRGSISEKTRKNVNDAIEYLGYYPNEVARSLHGSKTNLIGVLLPNVSNPFYGEIATELENELAKHKYKVLLCNTNNDLEKETNYLKMLLSNQVDGIITGSRNFPSEIYQKANLAIVAIDRFVSSEVPNVRSDNYMGACLATEYLIEKKCKKIALFTGSPEGEIKKGDYRAQGYLDTINKHNREALVFMVSFDADETYQRKKVAECLDLHPDLDGIFATGDILAGIVNSIARKKNKEPEIVGYDGTEAFLSFCGNVSTIRQPVKEMAKVATDVIMDIIADEFTDEKREFVLPVSFVERSY